jgi:transcriptional regulator with XRE-family HTH domain
MNLAELGNRIRQRREARGLKQADLAHALQISAQAVSKWERGENAPDITQLVPLSGLLGVSVEWLLVGARRERDVFEATVLVSSVLGYAHKSAEWPLRELATWANALLTPLTEIVLAQDGVPVKQLGDGILCFFSGNRHADRALAAARQARRIIAEPLKMALASGPIYLGRLGHPDYAQLDIVGEAVNVAFCALGWLGGERASGIVAAASVIDAAEESGETGFRRQVILAARAEPVTLVEVTGPEK